MIDDPTGNTIQHRISYRPASLWERNREVFWQTLGCAGVWVLLIAAWIGFGS